MAYRDDHDAALARIDALERELAATKEKLATTEAERTAAPSPPAPAPAAPSSPAASHAADLRVDRGDAQIQMSWSGWGAGNFVSATLLFGLPGFAALVAGAWIALGAPRTTPYNLPLPWFILVALIAVWNTAALVANRGNRIVVSESTVDAQQGRVPWPVAYRRRRIARSEIRGVDVDHDWNPESEVTRFKVMLTCAGGARSVTGSLSSDDLAYAIASELAAALGAPPVKRRSV